MTTKIAVFASGSGSNFQAIAESITRGELDASIELVVTDKPGAFVVNRAQNFGIEVLELSPKSFETVIIGSVIGSHVGLGSIGIFFTDAE